MKCGGYDFNIVIMSIEEACRFDKDIYDCLNWILMKCRKIDELWENIRTLVEWWFIAW